jgi:hypothetical protein
VELSESNNQGFMAFFGTFKKEGRIVEFGWMGSWEDFPN